MAINWKEEARCGFAEFIATLLFVFFGPGSVSAALQATGGLGPVEPVNYALSFGWAITILAFAIGDISGGHINPAVTLSMLVTKNVSPVRALIYMTAQVLGGLCGGGILCAAVGQANYKSGIGLAPTVTAGGGLVLEIMGTLLLIFVVFNVAVWASSSSSNMNTSVISALAPIPIGLAVMVSHLTLGPFTGCGINPARVIGAVVFETGFFQGHAGKNFWIYIVGPFIASLLGPAFYMILEGTSKAGADDAKKAGDKVAPGDKVPPGETPVEAFKQ